MPAILKSMDAEYAQDYLRKNARKKAGEDALIEFAHKNPFGARILQLRYAHGLSFVEIALEMKKSTDRIKHLHGAALERFFPYAKERNRDEK